MLSFCLRSLTPKAAGQRHDAVRGFQKRSAAIRVRSRSAIIRPSSIVRPFEQKSEFLATPADRSRRPRSRWLAPRR